MNEILPNLFLGDLQDALANLNSREYDIVTVLETWPFANTPTGVRAWVPLLGTAPDGRVDRRALDIAAGIIATLRTNGRKVLVHCGAGIERGPLATAWYLVWSKNLPDLEKAYEFIRERRPQVQDRRAWIA